MGRIGLIAGVRTLLRSYLPRRLSVDSPQGMTKVRSMPRKVGLCTSAEAALTLVYYGPGLVQPHHVHQGAQMSVLLAGGFREQSGRSDTAPSLRVSALKSAGASHAVTFGRHGALMLSINCADDIDVPLRQAGDWRPLSVSANALAVAMVTASDRQEMLSDLMAAIRYAPLPAGRTPPTSVRKLKEALDDDPSRVRINDIAHTSDVHRVYLSRAFTAAYGTPPSLYRLRRMNGHALALACHEGLSLAQVAAEAGFADQSHLTRSFSRDIGLNPAAVRQLFKVTSVQDVTARWA